MISRQYTCNFFGPVGVYGTTEKVELGYWGVKDVEWRVSFELTSSTHTEFPNNYTSDLFSYKFRRPPKSESSICMISKYCLVCSRSHIGQNSFISEPQLFRAELSGRIFFYCSMNNSKMLFTYLFSWKGGKKNKRFVGWENLIARPFAQSPSGQ